MKEFEHIALNTLLNEKEYFNKVVGLLKPTHMTDIGNQYILKIIKQYYTEYKRIPTITDLITSVKNVENLEIRKVIKESLISVNEIKPTDNVEFMINETVDYIKDSMYLDALRIGSEGLMKKDNELKQKAQQILDERAKINVDSDLGIDFDDIEEMIAYYSEKNIGILTQHKSFNKCIIK